MIPHFNPITLQARMTDTPKKKSTQKYVATRRPRGSETSGRKYTISMSVYYTHEEYELVTRAAELERQSKSAFVADAALNTAMETIRRYNRMQAMERTDVEDVPKKKPRP